MRKQPYLDDLEEIVPSRYSMVLAVAKRARQILQEESDEESPYLGVVKPVSIAMYELLDKKYEVIETSSENKGETSNRKVQEFDDIE
ncbi:MAG: DNA-directed RNA polymerase subunit omega [Firmicutes bacterium]|nr:DNA-directed RNA polymerase subunit omega [Bacillota bacterium]MDD4264440.1 DNA-directed RNA polymerase subunit omega [Bacillota bacterium]MDD4694660.1 DNA-directed RNA polymerase subunit omega [Bacillota bacterium]